MAVSKARACLAVGSLAFSGAFSSAALADTRMVAPPVEGYFVANEAANGNGTIKEEIPVGETLETWTTIITTHRVPNPTMTAMQFAQGVQDGVVASCPNHAKGEPGEQEHQGYKAASFSATCYEGDTPETFFMMVIKAPDALHVRQMAFREDVSEENMKRAIAILRSAVICEDDCPEGML